MKAQETKELFMNYINNRVSMRYFKELDNDSVVYFVPAVGHTKDSFEAIVKERNNKRWLIIYNILKEEKDEYVMFEIADMVDENLIDIAVENGIMQIIFHPKEEKISQKTIAIK